jgi:hypothetical protein
MDNVLEMKRPDPFAKADAAFQKGIDAYIEWGQEMAKLNEAGHTQQELGERYDCSQAGIAQAMKVGTDPRIIRNPNNLPKNKSVLYLLSTLDDKDFDEIARPDLREHEIKEYKQMKKGKPPPKRHSWHVIAVEEGLLPTTAGGAQKKAAIAEMLEVDPGLEYKNSEHEDRLRAACRAVNAKHGKMPPEVDPATLTKKDQRVLDKALARLQAEFHQEVAKEVEKRLDDARERQLQNAKQQARSAKELQQVWKARVDSCKDFLHMFQDNWRTVASSIHPDRPERTKEQLENASAAMNKMKAAFERIALDKWGS